MFECLKRDIPNSSESFVIAAFDETFANCRHLLKLAVTVDNVPGNLSTLSRSRASCRKNFSRDARPSGFLRPLIPRRNVPRLIFSLGTGSIRESEKFDYSEDPAVSRFHKDFLRLEACEPLLPAVFGQTKWTASVRLLKGIADCIWH